MALLWLPEQSCAVAAKQGEWSPARGLSEASRLPQRRGVSGKGSLSAARFPAPRRAPRGPGSPPRRLAGGSGPRRPRFRAHEVSLSLRQLSPACCGRRLPRQSPVRSRGAAGCMSSSRLYSPPPPAPRSACPPARSCHGPGMQTSGWEQKALLGPDGGGGEPSSLAARSARPEAGSVPRAALRPFPARAAPLRALRRAQPGGGRGRRAEAGPRRSLGGAGKTRDLGKAGGGGNWKPRRRRRGFSVARGEGPGIAPLCSPRPRPPRPADRGDRTAPPPEGEKRREGTGVSRGRRANPLTKERPALLALAQPPAAPATPTRRAPSPAQGRANPKGVPPPSPTQPVLARATGAPSARRQGLGAAAGCLQRFRLEFCRQRLSPVSPMSPLACPAGPKIMPVLKIRHLC